MKTTKEPQNLPTHHFRMQLNGNQLDESETWRIQDLQNEMINRHKLQKGGDRMQDVRDRLTFNCSQQENSTNVNVASGFGSASRWNHVGSGVLRVSNSFWKAPKGYKMTGQRALN